LGVQVRRQRRAVGRRDGAGAQEGQATAYPLGHAAGAALPGRAGRDPQRAAGGGTRPPRPGLTALLRPALLRHRPGLTSLTWADPTWPDPTWPDPTWPDPTWAT